mgnify:CR=1 FL=1
MKYIGWLIFIILCYPAGQVFHRIADLSSLGVESSPEDEAVTPKEFTFGGSSGALVVRIDPTSVTAAELPEKVTLKRRVQLGSSQAGNTVTLEAGATVRVMSVEGGNLTISALSGPLQGMVALAHTDCLEKVVRIRGARVFSDAPPVAVAVQPPPSEPEPAPTPPPVAQVDSPAPEPEPVPEDAEEEPEPTPAAEELDSDAIVAAMEEHIEGGALEEFTSDQVQDWKAGEDEEIDGENYQTGLVTYKAETIFGVKTVQAKALFLNGKIEKWVYAKTGMEIK